MQKKRGVSGNKNLELALVGLSAIAMLALSFVVLIVEFPYLNPFPSLDPRSADVINLEKSDADSIISLNFYMNARYNREIYPEANQSITAELERARSIPDPEARLDEIFKWEMNDWIEPNSNLSAVVCPNAACTYELLADDHNRVMAGPYYDGILYPQKNADGTMFADDPYWIAYNKVGECREYSTLFAFMAQESGIESHLVRTSSHQWVEVELANGSYYYDPWCAHVRGYYNALDGNMTFRDKWFNTIGSYEENCNPPDPYPISYTEYPYIMATPKYLEALGWHTLSEELNGTLPE
nr:transglutaminase domain-containing protein [uncultured Methanoregula sp.]